ncbi:MAG: hypothetical protein J7480_07875 [Microbacteriaceae bacterium]|nr:hypothetical protein [Microbacteriaceae bacterium]
MSAGTPGGIGPGPLTELAGALALRSVYRRWLRPRLRADRVTRMLDIGSAGDAARRILGWARQDGLALGLVAIDADHRAVLRGRGRPAWGMTARTATPAELIAEGAKYDLILSDRVLGQLRAPEVGALLSECDDIVAPDGLVVHTDIVCSRFGTGRWSQQELIAVVPPGWQVRRCWPLRVEIVRAGSEPSGDDEPADRDGADSDGAFLSLT